MTTISAELKRIEKAEQEAYRYIESGDWRKARRCIKKVSNSFCVSEADRAILLIHAEILLHQRKTEDVKKLLKERLDLAWGSVDAWAMYRDANFCADHLTHRYTMTVYGPNKIMGEYDRLVDFEILANSQQEAVDYINEIELFYEEGFSVMNVVKTREYFANEMKRGILFPSPFYCIEEPEELAAEELH